MQNLPDDEIGRVRSARRALEVDVAKSIGKHLINNQKGYVKRLILAMVDEILDLVDEEPALVEGFLIRQTPFAMWKLCQTVPTSTGLERVREHVEQYRPQGYAWLNVCADVIRLFGEFAEQPWVRGRTEPNWHVMARKDDLRPKPVFAKPEQSDVGWGHRHRLERPVAERRRIDTPFVNIPRERVEWRGAEKYALGADSVIKSIDWAFGLQVEGGDVSGTTTDSIAALRWASRSVGVVNPIAHLIAIATMVPQGHHTMVECAWPLTRHGFMDYVIGFYDTLVPPDQEVGGLRGDLAKWNDDVRNKHVFLCRDASRTLQLNFWFEKRDEVEEYRKFAGVRRAYGFCVGGHPTITSAANMMKAHGVADLVISRMYSWVGRS